MRIVPYLALILAPPLLAAPALAQQFGDPQLIANPVIHSHLSAADIDDDGDLDILIDSGWYEHDGAGGFSAVQQILGSGGWLAADLNADQRTDIIRVSGAGIEWCENVGGGAFAGPFLVSASRPEDVVVGDIDGDGDLDIVSSGIVWHENLGNGSFSADLYVGPNAQGGASVDSHLVAVDLDGDGDLDIAQHDLPPV